MTLLSEHNEFAARKPLYPSVAELAVKIDKTLNNDFEEEMSLFLSQLIISEKFFRANREANIRRL